MDRYRTLLAMTVVLVAWLQPGIVRAEAWDFDVYKAKEMEDLEYKVLQLDDASWNDVIPIWAERLRDSDRSIYEKQVICRLMAQRGVGQATGALAQCLPQDDLTEFAAEGLARAASDGNAAARDEIVAALESLEGRPLLTLLEQLLCADVNRFPEVLPLARKHSESSDTAVRRAALNVRAASGQIEEAESLADLWHEGDADALDALLRSAPDVSDAAFTPVYEGLAGELASLKPADSHAVLCRLAESAPDVATARAADWLLSADGDEARPAWHFLLHTDPAAAEASLLEFLKTSLASEKSRRIMKLLGRRRSQQVYDVASTLYRQPDMEPQTRARLAALMLQTVPKSAGGDKAASTVHAQDEANDELVQFVLGLMGESEVELRAVALEQVRSEIPGSAATVLFAEQLPNLAPEAQVGLLSALCDRADDAARPAIVQLLQTSDNPSVRIAAIESISTLGSADDLDALMHFLTNGTPAEQMAARATLTRLADPSLSLAIAERLPRADAALRVTLIEILGSRRATEAATAVLPFVAEDDSAVRGAAMTVLGELAGPQHVRCMLQGVLRAEPGRERETAEKCVMFVCQRSQDPAKQANPVLAAMADLPDDDRITLVPTLGRIGGPLSRQVVDSVIAKTNPTLHDVGIRSLCNWPDATVAPRLLELAKDDPHADHQIMALRALIRIAPLPDARTDLERLDLLKNAYDLCTRDTERQLVLQRAAAIRIVESLQFVLPRVDEPALREQACLSVVELAHHQALREGNASEFQPALRKVQETAEDPVVVDRASRYLRGETWYRPK